MSDVAAFREILKECALFVKNVQTILSNVEGKGKQSASQAMPTEGDQLRLPTSGGEGDQLHLPTSGRPQSLPSHREGAQLPSEGGPHRVPPKGARKLPSEGGPHRVPPKGARKLPSEGGQRKRRKKSRDAPKRPLSSYMLFVREVRPAIVDKHPEAKFTEIGKIIGEQWARLPEEKKYKYVRMAEDDKRRYQLEMEAVCVPVPLHHEHTEDES